MKKGIIIVGMGSGLSFGIAEKFGSEGYAIGMISRTAEKLAEFQKNLSASGIESFYEAIDVADTERLKQALRALKEKLGRVDVLEYNAVDFRMGNVMTETIETLTNGFKISVGNALEAVKELLPELKKNSGAVLLTGGGSANYPNPDMSTISLGKAGIKNLTYQLNAALKADGVYVGTVTVSGWIQPDSPTHSPKLLADLFWKLHQERTQIEIVQ